MRTPKLQIFHGNATPELASRIAECLKTTPGRADVATFPDGEVSVRVREDVRGNDVFVVQSTCPPVNENLMELLVLVDCLRRSSAMRITAVVPYFGYARMDRKAEGRVPITAKLVANLLTTAGADRVLSIDLHADQIQGFFDIPVDHLYASPVLGAYFTRLDRDDLVVAAPDVGGIKMARAYAKRLGADLAIVDKRRTGPETAKVMHVIGKVEGRPVVLVDDMIATGGSIRQAVRTLREKGATDIYVAATHGVLCGPARERLEDCPVREIVLTDTMPVRDRAPEGTRVLSVAPLLARAIERIHNSESVSSLFEDPMSQDVFDFPLFRGTKESDRA
jgi:ribose-phosphate pyrophosphokinase